jgi:hypothetical protein
MPQNSHGMKMLRFESENMTGQIMVSLLCIFYALYPLIPPVIGISRCKDDPVKQVLCGRYQFIDLGINVANEFI